MLAFSIHGVHHFIDLLNFIHGQVNYYNNMDFKCSKAKLTVIVSRPSPTPSIIELQTMPQFFTHFFCNKPFHSSMSVNDYYDILFDMKQTDFDLIAMSHWEGNAYLKFIFFSPSR